MTRLKINRPQPFVFKDKPVEAIYQGQNRYPIGQEIIAYEPKKKSFYFNLSRAFQFTILGCSCRNKTIIVYKFRL